MSTKQDSRAVQSKNISVTHPEDVLVFSWEVDDEGYRWVRAKEAMRVGDPDAAEDLYLVALGRVGQLVTRYAPLLTERALFRVFSEIAPTQEGILAFASKYGLLGADASQVIVAESRVVVGDRASVWFDEILKMRHAVRLWDMVTAQDSAGLARHITWAEDASGVRYESQPGWTGGYMDPDDPSAEIRWIASRDDRREAFSSLEPGDLYRPARLQIQWAINEHLKGRASPRLLWDRSWSDLDLHLVPTGLVGALWLQFAQAVTGDRQFKTCIECKRWYQVHPESARADRQYCSDACRVRAYRKRRDAAT